MKGASENVASGFGSDASSRARKDSATQRLVVGSTDADVFKNEGLGLFADSGCAWNAQENEVVGLACLRPKLASISSMWRTSWSFGGLPLRGHVVVIAPFTELMPFTRQKGLGGDIEFARVKLFSPRMQEADMKNNAESRGRPLGVSLHFGGRSHRLICWVGACCS